MERARLGIDYLPAVAHAAGPGRYARELVRALVRVAEAPELALYEVGRAPRAMDERSLGLEGTEVRQKPTRVQSRWPRRLAELTRAGDERLAPLALFHRILPDTPRLARTPTTIALSELPEGGGERERAWSTALQAASAVFVFCQDLRARAAERFGIPLERIHVVPVGCEHWRRELPGQLSGPVPRADPPRLVVLGEPGPRRAELEAAAHGLGRTVELVLARERAIVERDLPQLLASASALVHLPRAAGTAVTPLEALALGTPVVVERLPVFVEALGQEAFWVGEGPSGLRDALAAALTSAADPAASARRMDHARAFTWERCARAHVAVWRALLARGAQGLRPV